jgi:hypothetical protein
MISVGQLRQARKTGRATAGGRRATAGCHSSASQLFKGFAAIQVRPMIYSLDIELLLYEKKTKKISRLREILFVLDWQDEIMSTHHLVKKKKWNSPRRPIGTNGEL